MVPQLQHGPSADTVYPQPANQRVVFLKNVITNPNIIVGEYTYYDDRENPEAFERNVLYHFDFVGDKLIIGKFCSIAEGVTFIMNGGNHRTDWFTNYPFPVFGHGWEAAMPRRGRTKVTRSSETTSGPAMVPCSCPGFKLAMGRLSRQRRS